MKTLKTCCDCVHFRMFKPKKMYCTIKKGCVNPLQELMDCYEGRENKERKGVYDGR